MANGRKEIPLSENGSVEVGPNEKLRTTESGEPASVELLDDENRRRLDAASPLPAMPFGFQGAPTPIRVEIITNPGDADIYIDGLKTGVGRFQGMLPKGTVITVRVRRRGFIDSSFEIIADKDKRRDVNLKASNLEETLSEPEDSNPLLERLRADYEQQLAELNSSFANRNRQDAESEEERNRIIESLKETVSRRERDLSQSRAEAAARIEMEKAQRALAETELAESRAENERLRDLIVQIQELAAEERKKTNE